MKEGVLCRCILAAMLGRAQHKTVAHGTLATKDAICHMRCRVSQPWLRAAFPASNQEAWELSAPPAPQPLQEPLDGFCQPLGLSSTKWMVPPAAKPQRWVQGHLRQMHQPTWAP